MAYREDQHGNIVTEDGKVVVPITARTPTEVYSRCCGYLRPVEQWNIGKQTEFKDRRVYVNALELAGCNADPAVGLD